MACPKGRVRLSFDEDTVRLRIASSYWCEDWRRVVEQPRRIEEIWSGWHRCDASVDSFVVDWRDSCRAIEDAQIGISRQVEESYQQELRRAFYLSESELEEWQNREEEHNAYWTPTYMGPIRSWYDEEAGVRAERLLGECLSPAQKEEFNYTRSFTVVSRSNRTYRIEFTRTYNVKLIDDTKRSLVTYCAGPLEEVPIADMMLAQKLMLENDEERFLKIANTQGGPLEEFVRSARERGIVDEFRRLL